jgi:hypothetical protein
MEATPAAQALVAVAVNVAGAPTVLLLAGAVMYTPLWPPLFTLIVTAEVVAPPQLSHSTITTL